VGVQLFQYEITFFDGRHKATRIVVATDVVEAAATARIGCDLHPGYRLSDIRETMRPAWCTTDDMQAPQQVSEVALREYARRLGFEVSKSL
jgi:hypothetical protein